MGIFCRLQAMLNSFRALDFLAPLAMRLYLAPVFLMAGLNKHNSLEDTAAWFGNPDWGLGLPAPELMAYLATYTELLGGVMLIIGLGVRWVSIPLMVTMLVAAFAVHWENGWFAIADKTACLFNCDGLDGAAQRLDAAKGILQQHGNYDWLTESGSFVILNNGIEFAATYFIMLLALFFMGAGKYFSIDYYVAKRCHNN